MTLLLAVALQAAETAQSRQQADKQKLADAIFDWVGCSNQQARRLDDGKSEVKIVVAAVRVACSHERHQVRDMYVETTRSSSDLLGMPLDEAAIQRVADKSLAQSDQSLDDRIAHHILEDRKR